MFTGGLTESTDPFPKRIPLFLVDGPSHEAERDPRLEDKRIPSEKRDPASRKLRGIPLFLSLIEIPIKRITGSWGVIRGHKKTGILFILCIPPLSGSLDM